MQSLRGARVNARLRVEHVAKSMGVSKMTVYNWEKGLTQPKVEQFRKLASLYGLKMEEIK